MTSENRIVALCDGVDYICRSHIEGDVVECGVWKGGSMMAAALQLLSNNDSTRRLWLFDTFDGMSDPTSFDIDHCGNDAIELMNQSDRDDSASIWCCSDIAEVKRNMDSTNYPGNLINYTQGPVEETLATTVLPEKIALLRLDTDWYESTKSELEHLFPRLVPGGVLIIDDYGHWKGCRKAVDEYFSSRDIRILLNRIDYTGRIAVKIPQFHDKETIVAS